MRHPKKVGRPLKGCGKGAFAVKMYALEQQYEEMRGRILMYQQTDHARIRSELSRIEVACHRDELSLQESIASCDSPAVVALAGVQKEYIEKARDVLERYIGQYRSGVLSDDRENRAEAMALYAEYAIDFATQAINHAQLATLSAIDLQMTATEQ